MASNDDETPKVERENPVPQRVISAISLLMFLGCLIFIGNINGQIAAIIGDVNRVILSFLTLYGAYRLTSDVATWVYNRFMKSTFEPR